MIRLTEACKYKLDRLCVFRGFREDSVSRALDIFLQHPATETYSALFYAMLERKAFGRLRGYIANLLYYGEGPFAYLCECGTVNPLLLAAAQADIDALGEIVSVRCADLAAEVRDRADNLPAWAEDTTSPALPDAETLAAWYRRNGTGIFARYTQFQWDNGKLIGVTKPDPVRLSDFVGYELQRQMVVDNTKRLLQGLPANNVLLYGDRGTGKSSTVKAIGNEFGEQGLRIIELPKNQMTDFGKMLRHIEKSVCKFIIFIDDLAFENNEGDYTMLKALLEGGLAAKPENVAIYATSNRRNLIKETFRDRQALVSSDPDEEVHASDNMQEKLSLADRFGLRVTFSAPNQSEFLDIVKGLAKKRGIVAAEDDLCRRALVWEMENNGKSPRTARQFVDSL